jgi:putative membrane protein
LAYLSPQEDYSQRNRADRERRTSIAVLQHWSFDPFIVVIAVVAGVHARGLRLHVRAIAKSGRSTRPWIGQAFIFWGGLIVLLLAVVSPIEYWSDT